MYLKWDEKTIADFLDKNITAMYNDGYLFGRPHKGMMYQTRSVRIDLSKFEMSSENRRVLKKTEGLEISNYQLPITNYDWNIGKLAKDFYDTKFGKGTFSANKVKEILTTDHNFNTLFVYSNENKLISNWKLLINEKTTVGFCIALETDKIVHYSYPFYQLPITNYYLPNVGMSMMLKTILYAQKNNKQYIYIGSASRPTDIYKLQFKGLEWFDGEEWKDDLEELKKILQK